MEIDWHDLSFRWEFWMLVAFILGCLQMLTDEFFFGGACIGALTTGIALAALGLIPAQTYVNLSIPYIMCGVGGLVGATLMRQVCKRRCEPPDINEEPYRGEDL
jgi:membrane protein implicated in regulation of membrane protease activity